jgi:hypothetical protein
MIVAYAGNGAYCYSNALHMCLRAAGAAGDDLPDPGLVECLTTMPFGVTYLRGKDGPLVFFDGLDPERGVQRALRALGWACDVWHGTGGAAGQADGEAALGRLRAAVAAGPALLGPLDMGYLPYRPGTPRARGADHYVVALAAEGGRVRVHDPGGYPCAVLGEGELLTAWRGEAIGYKPGPYTLRSGFRRIEAVERAEAVARTLPLARENVVRDPGGPECYGGSRALRLLAADLRGAVPAGLAGHLTGFALPLGARRALDAAGFLAEADRPAAARAMEAQALLLGEAQYLAARGRWPEAADVAERLAGLQDDLAAALA